MILSDALSSCFGSDFEHCGQTYESIVWKHIPEDVYDKMTTDEKSNFHLNETSNVRDSYALKQILLTDGTVAFDTLKTQKEYEILGDDVKSNFSPVYRMYSKKPIPLEEIEAAYTTYRSVSKPMMDLRKKRNILLKDTDIYTILDWPHPTEEAKRAWLDYRQALRDLPANTTDPNKPEWPTPPE